MRKCVLALALASSVCTAFAGTVFYWRGGGEWNKWNDATKWSVTRGADDNPSSLLPTADDTIWGYGYGFTGDNGRYGYFDLDGGSYEIAGFDAGSGSGTNWKTYYLHIDNGTLTIRNPNRPSGVSITHSFKVYEKGGLVFPSGTGVHLLGISGLYSNWEVCSGGRMEVLSDEIQLGNVNCTVAVGGTMVFDPSAMCVSSEVSKDNVILNQGTFIAPKGILWNGTDWKSPYSSGYNKILTVRQDYGTMILGGGFTKAQADSKRAATMAFTLSGGTLVASNSVSFYNSVNTYGPEVSATMTKNATVEVLADSSLDMSLFTYSPSVTLTKKGPGPLTLANLPSSLALNAGKAVLTKALAAGDSVTCSPGVTVEFGVPGSAAPSGISGYAAASFAVTPGAFKVGDVVVSSENADFLTHVCAQLADQAPEGARAAVSGGAVRFVVNVGHIFEASGERSLDDPTCWNDGEVPAGADVHLSGAETIGVIDASTTAFKSISIEDGATLKVVGSGVALPPVSLTRTGRLLVAEDAAFSIGVDTVTFGGDEAGLPVFEIASNAVCTVAGGFVFKNVDLRLYGQVKLDETATDWMTFGGTADGETAYFAMTAIGGSIYAKGNSTSLKRFIYPGANGRVKVVGDMLFKDVTFLPSSFGADNSDGYNGFYFGNNNPGDEVFNVILDNTTFPVIRNCYVSGGARVIVRNGGGFRKGPYHPGVATTFMVTALAQVRLEGPGSGIEFPHTETGGFSFSPNRDDYEALTLVDGAYVKSHDLGGNFVRLVVSNGVWCVPTLPMVPPDHNPYPPDGDARNWMTNAFCCFAGGVRIEPNSTLYLKSTGGLGGTEWNRHMTLANRSITGEGAFMMENGTPGYAFTATIVSGANTCTGPLGVVAGTDPTTLYLNDGANWAGQVRSAGVALTNIAASASAAVGIGELLVDGTMPVRVWSAEGMNDTFRLSGSIIAAGGRLKPVEAGTNGRIPAGYSFVLGTCPETADIPEAEAFLPRGWLVRTESTGDGRKSIILTRMPIGLSVIVK